MQNTLFYAEREFQSLDRLAARAANQEQILQSLSASNAAQSSAGLMNRMAAGTRSLVRLLLQAAPEAERLSSESRRPQEQCC
ncbi:MAG: hypothetical protein AMJ93_13225 [Anaerolineae bacterium SM23_84]|nr:MAG: hypothetical protein AMJ93_13225 [Anaerolineae bacterium SM23_84]